MSAEITVCRCGTPLRWNVMAQRHMESCKCPPLSPAAEAEFATLRAQLAAQIRESEEHVEDLEAQREDLRAQLAAARAEVARLGATAHEAEADAYTALHWEYVPQHHRASGLRQTVQALALERIACLGQRNEAQHTARHLLAWQQARGIEEAAERDALLAVAHRVKDCCWSDGQAWEVQDIDTLLDEANTVLAALAGKGER